ncbi:DNA polymerase III subunit alpha [Myroides sp. LJL116]
MFINSHTYYSLRYGTLSVEELVDLAHKNSLTTLALTDINNTTAMYSFIQECQKKQIKPVVGVDFRKDNIPYYIQLAKNKKGLAQIHQLISQVNQNRLCLPTQCKGSDHYYTIYPISNLPKELQENQYIGITTQQVNLLYDPKYKKWIDKMVVLQPITIQSKEHLELHKILRAIDQNILLTQISDQNTATEHHQIQSISSIEKAFENYPIILQNTKDILQDCAFTFDWKVSRNKKHFTQDKASDFALLTKLALKGLQEIYGPDNQKALERTHRELEVIQKLDFCGYFLITWDIVCFSKSQGFMHIGRGSGANSIVGYLLGITNVCPLELDLYFERFLNENRNSPPDFDIDWSWDQRDVILNYIFKKYGQDHVAFCGAISTFKYRSSVREIGKVLGLNKQELDQLSKKNTYTNTNSITDLVLYYATILQGFPNQRTMHACGVIISQEPLYNVCALDYPPKGFAVIQMDMHTASDIGYEKFDILSQRGIGHIKEATELVLQNKNISIDIQDISLSKDHPLCNAALEKGHTIGCFYIESPAMRGLLKKLQCDNYKTLVAASSIIRPGVAKSGMMQEYIFRHNNPTCFEYFHPVFEQQLKQTYGIMVYQEDVIKIALHFAGLPPSDGDLLRRAMSGKTRSLDVLQQIKNRFFDHCIQKGHSLDLTQKIYQQIESFAGYSFCKAHSASYAIESYQSLYLKVHYPLEFITAVINNQGGFYRTEVYLHEAKMAGAIIHPPCINTSDRNCVLKQNDLYLGLAFLQSISEQTIENILSSRNLFGDFLDLEDFLQRVDIGIETMQNLIFVGAFKCFNASKSELLILGRLLMQKPKRNLQPTLLQSSLPSYEFPTLKRSITEDAYDEIELLGFSVSCSVFDLLKTSYKGDFMADELINQQGKVVKMLGYLICTKHVPTNKGSMYFGTWIDARGHYFDTVHFSDSIRAYPFVGPGCYLLLGKVQLAYGQASLEIQKMALMPFIDDPRYVQNSDLSNRAINNLKLDISTTNRAPYPRAHEINLPRTKL